MKPNIITESLINLLFIGVFIGLVIYASCFFTKCADALIPSLLIYFGILFIGIILKITGRGAKMPRNWKKIYMIIVLITLAILLFMVILAFII